MKNFLLSDWAPFFRAAAGRVAYVVACAIVAAEIAYRAGLATGRTVHRLSDLLAGLASGRIDRAETARAVAAWARATLAAPESAPAPAAVVITAEHRCAPAMDARAVLADVSARLQAAESLEDAAAAMVTMACAAVAAAPTAGIAPPPVESLTVAQLRAMARARGFSALARKGRRSDLIAALA